MNCLFCKISNKDIEAKVVYEDEVIIAILDAYPDAEGHTLIIPKKHYNDFKELDNEIINHIFNIAKMLETRYENKLNYTGISYLWNYKDSQIIKHFHLHMLPDYQHKKPQTPLDVLHDILK